MKDQYSASERRANILIADDHEMFRDTLHLYIGHACPDYKFYLASNLHEVVDVLNRNSFLPDLCIIDFLMPGMQGVDSVKALLKSYPDTKIAIMSGMAGKQDVEKIIDSNIAGFVPKTMSGRTLISAVEIMLSGKKFIPYGPDKAVLASHLYDPLPEAPDVGLTSREKEVLVLLCEGFSNSVIADKLGLKVVTIKLHMRNIFQKLDCGNRTQAAMKAREWGIVK